jgi:8-oxo-dGTP pyrophosphatase MutT (NUDIX family)
VSEPAKGVLQDTPARRPVLDRKVPFHGKVWDVVTERVELGGDGESSEVVTRDFVASSGAVAVVAYRDPGEVLVLRQYRHPVGRELWEPPAGMLDVAGEDPLETARRELREEADLVADTWHVLVDVFTTPGGSSEALRIYLARDLTDVPVGQRFEREAEERDMEVRWIPLDEAVAAVVSGRFSSPTSVAGFLALDVAVRSGWETLRPTDAPWARP